jgi:hypothetical protein
MDPRGLSTDIEDTVRDVPGASQRWQRIRITDAERTHLLRLRQDLGLPLHRAVCAHEPVAPQNVSRRGDFHTDCQGPE